MEKRIKTMFISIFIIYLTLLVFVILLKYDIKWTYFVITNPDRMPISERWHWVNIVPFKTIAHYIFENDNLRISIPNLLGNIIAFAPFGLLLPLIVEKVKNYKSIIMTSFFLSFTFEIIQLITSIGVFDVDDIILNVMGAVFGFTMYKGLKNVYLGRESQQLDKLKS